MKPQKRPIQTGAVFSRAHLELVSAQTSGLDSNSCRESGAAGVVQPRRLCAILEEERLLNSHLPSKPYQIRALRAV